MIEADVCIIGGGIMGTAAAYWLSKTSKQRIILLEQHTIGNEYCSSNDANRVFRYSYGKDEFYTRMAAQTLDMWKDLERTTGQELLIPSGLLLLQGEDEESNKFNQDSYHTLTQLQLGVEDLNQSELNKQYPQFHAQQAYLDTHGGVLLASKALTTLASLSTSQGVTIIENHKATGLQYTDRVEVVARQDIVRAKKVIITTGPWTNMLRSNNLPMITPTRQQIIYFQPPNLGMYRPARFPVFFADHYYGIPAAGIEAVKVSHKGLPDPVDPDRANRMVDLGMGTTCREVCGRFIPSLADAPVHQSKVCLYDMAPHSDFIITRDPEHPVAIYAYGFSGHGFKFAPLIGKLLSELAQDQQPSLDLARFTPQNP